MAGRESVRLFLAFMLPDETAERLADWQQRELTGGRIVVPENLHVTLAFLGSTPVAALDVVAGTLAAVADVQPPRFVVDRYRETRSVGMLVLRDLAGTAGLVADGLHERLEMLGVYEREQRRWLPHVTVLRFREPPRLRPALPDLGEFAPSGVAAYMSVLRPTGARYEVLDSVALGGR